MTLLSFGHGLERHHQTPGRPACREAGQGRTRAAGGRARRARSSLLSGRRAADFRRGIRRALSALRGNRAALSAASYIDEPDAARWRRTGRQVQESSPRGADAVALERLQRRGRHGFRRADQALPQIRRQGETRFYGRAQDRRTFLLAALRARRAHGSGHARRRRGRRGRHRQCAHDQGRAANTEGQGRAGPDRSARRGLYAPRRFSGTEQASGGRGREDFRQSAQFRRRFPAAARPQGHRESAAASSSPMAGAGGANCPPTRNTACWSRSNAGACRSIP